MTKHTPDAEAEAISTIAKALAGLSDERKLAVLSFTAERFGGKALTAKSPIEDKNDSDSGGGSEGTIKQFLKTKSPSTKYQQVAVLAYFLKKHGDEDGVNKESIEAANRDAGGRTIDNISMTLNDAKNKYGYFGSGTGGKKNLLAYGEDVVEALPDQEKVKELAKKHSRKPKKKVSAKSKKVKSVKA